MTAYTPQEYAEQVWNGKVTSKTIRNWISSGKMPKNTRMETTPTGRYIIHVDDMRPASNVDHLVKLLEGKAA